LSSFTLAIDDLPEEVGRKLPRYDAIPAALIGRLACNVRVRGKGIGEWLLADAVRRVLGASRTLAVFAIVVEAKDATASAFYEGFGFRPFPCPGYYGVCFANAYKVLKAPGSPLREKSERPITAVPTPMAFRCGK